MLLPKGHPYSDKDLSNLYNSLGLGYYDITYSENYSGFIERSIKKNSDYKLDKKLAKRIKKEGYDFLKDYWCIGFDTAHAWNTAKIHDKKYVFKEARKLYFSCLDNNNPKILIWNRKMKLEKIKNKK